MSIAEAIRQSNRINQPKPKKHIEFETRAVYNKQFTGDTLMYGILFHTNSDRTAFIRAAQEGLSHDTH